MKIVYFSNTGNINRFLNKLAQDSFEQIKGYSQLIIHESIILFTYTTGIGEVPSEVKRFCENNHNQITYVIASGNRNWGKLFALSGDIIAKEYNADLLYKFEISGTQRDVDNVRNFLDEIKRGLNE